MMMMFRKLVEVGMKVSDKLDEHLLPDAGYTNPILVVRPVNWIINDAIATLSDQVMTTCVVQQIKMQSKISV
jgi:hypothetical protein